MKAALLIATYNWAESLELVLKSALLQTQLPNEILIADDGSFDATKIVVEEFQKKNIIPIHYFSQEDKGFRKAKILNKAIAKTDADYIIQVDGDCIMHEKFVEDHLRTAQKGVYLYGSRVNILIDFVKDVLVNKQIKFHFFSKEIKNRTRGLYIPFLANFYKKHKKVSKKMRGCNISFWRNDFIAINGYNEDFEGWGREDSDLAIRLGNSGIKAKRLRFVGIVYHIYHKISSREKLAINDRIQKETISKNITRVVKGIDQYL